MNSSQKSELWFFWVDYNVFICEISLLNSISWIQNIEFSSIFSNVYYEFIIMKSDSWIQIEYNEFLYLNSCTYKFMYEFRIYTFELIYINAYTYEFIYYSFHIWIHVYIWIHMLHMNSCMNSYVYTHFIYEFT